MLGKRGENDRDRGGCDWNFNAFNMARQKDFAPMVNWLYDLILWSFSSMFCALPKFVFLGKREQMRLWVRFHLSGTCL